MRGQNMRINPISIGINNTRYNPVHWANSRAHSRETQAQQQVNKQQARVNEQLFQSKISTPYQTTKPTTAGQKALAVANFTASNMDIWKAIKKAFNIEMIDTVEGKFNRDELIEIFKTLAKVPKKHLEGICSIVKSESLGLEMELMHAKANGRSVLGAYDKAHKRIYIFNACPKSLLRKTLLHEIGHAVHSYTVSIKAVIKSIRRAGWKLKEYRHSYLAGNAFYPLVLQAKPGNEVDWEEAYNTFSEYELKKKHTADGRFTLEAPIKFSKSPVYKNPLETFACLYERSFA